MTPGISREDGQLKIRIMKGMELTVRETLGLVAGLVILFNLPTITTLAGDLPIRQRPIYRGIVFGLAAVGLNLLLRHSELVSFGHAAFFGTGAYTVAVLVSDYQVKSATVLLVAAIVAATLMAALIGYFTLPHTGLYFALITLAFGQLLFSIVKGQRALGGTDGISVRTGEAGVTILEQFPTLFGIQLTGQEVPNTILLWFTLVVVIISMLVMYRIVKSPFGRALDAIGQERTRARFLGLPVKRYVWAAFIISGIYGGIGGGLFALYFRSVAPGETLQVFVSGDILYMAILGGFGTLTGPLIGGIVLETLANIANEVVFTGPAGETQMGRFITGAVLLLIVFVFPKGIVGSLKPGGRVFEGAKTLKNDPTVAGPWFRQFGQVTVEAAKRSVKNVRYLLFGVK